MVLHLFSTFQFSVLVNGSSANIFGSLRRLRQGDPLYPMLFLIMVEVFSRMLKREEGAGLISGLRLMVARCWSFTSFVCILYYLVF